MVFNIAIYLSLEQQNNNYSVKEFVKSITKEERRFLDDLAHRESSGDYQKVNKFGYIGKYQFGEAALEELGYYSRVKNGRWNHKNCWEGLWTGKDGVSSKQEFLDNPYVQDKAAKELFMKNWQYIKSAGLHTFVGRNIQGIKITQSGLIAGMHLKGLGGLTKFLREKNNVKDGFGTEITEYIEKFSGYKIV